MEVGNEFPSLQLTELWSLTKELFGKVSRVQFSFHQPAKRDASTFILPESIVL